ncbi:MAG: MATE family efflux transporter [Candidatus Fimivivens sp.]
MDTDAAFQAEQDQKHRIMTQTPIPQLVGRLAIPTICAMLITAVYNMADTYFVSQIGTSASAAVGVIFSLMAIIQAVGFTFGIGSSVLVSRLLGEKRRQAACESVATSFFASLIFGVLLSIIGLLFLDELVMLLGATESIAPYALDYARYILIGAPYMAANFVLNTSLRGQGNAFYSMIGIMSGGLLNIVLDPIMIFHMGLGISGAALATIISQFISFIILFYFNLGKHGALPLKMSNVRLSCKLLTDIVKGGTPSLFRQGLASIAMVFMIRSCKPFGDPAIAAISIVTRLIMFVISAMIGFGQGFQPVCGFNYGAKRFDRVKESFWFCEKVSFLMLLIASVLMFWLAPQAIAAFRRDDLEVIAIGTTALRLQCLVLPFQSFFIMSNMYLQCTGQSAPATLLASARQGIFFLPGTLIWPALFGLLGVQMIQPISDVCCFILSIYLSRHFLRDLNQQLAHQLKAEEST